MTSRIILESPTDRIVFTGTGVESGWIYNNESLDHWYRLAPPEAKLTRRGNAHGSFSPRKSYVGNAEPKIIGRYFGQGAADAQLQRVRLNGFFADGGPVKMTVENTLTGESTYRTVFVTNVDPDWNHYDIFDFELDFVAPDPRRYGALVTSGDILPPSRSSGLVWPLGSSPSGLYFDWGTPGNPGAFTITNTGNATAYPTIVIGGDGTFGSGARIVEIETSREIAYPFRLGMDDRLSLNCRTRRARLGSSDVTDNLSSRSWFEVPAGQSRTYQIVPLGITTGAATFRVTLEPAYL